jgi:hypothetical protein
MAWNGRFNPVDPTEPAGSSAAPKDGAPAAAPAALAAAAPAPQPQAAVAEAAGAGKGARTLSPGGSNGRVSNGNGRVATLASGEGWAVAGVSGGYAAAAASGNGVAPARVAPAAAEGGGAAPRSSSGRHSNRSDSSQPPAAALAAAASAAPVPLSGDGPAPLRGVHEGEVLATMDDETAETQWPSREQEDPEYVI